MTEQIKVVSKLIGNFENLKPRRANNDSIYQDISDYILPNRGDFTKNTTPGERRDKRIFDTTAIQANKNLGSILHSGLTDPSTRWFNLVPSNAELRDNEDMKRWISEVHDVMFHSFSRSEGGFSQQNHEFFLDVTAYGTGVMWVAEEPGVGIVFQSRHLGEIHIEENSNGFVDTVYREFKYNARQAAQQWGEESLGPKLISALREDPHKQFKFLHVVLPTIDYQRISSGDSKTRFVYTSVYISLEDKNIVDTGGFHELPYLVARWEKLVGETYGRSPSWDALSDVIMLNLMSEVTIKAAQKQIDPPILMSDDGVMLPLQTFPGGVNIGGLSDDGRELLKPLITNARLDIGLEMMEQRREAIRSAYFVDQFQERRGVQPLTATESTHRQENRLRLIGPQIRRIEDEYLSPLINRVFGILKRKGKLPPLPQELLGQGVDEVDLSIEYISPLAFTQRTNQLLSYNRFFANAGTFIEFDQTAMDNFYIDKIVREAAEISGIPIDQIKSSEQVTAERQARAEQEQQMQQIAEIQAGAETAATLQKSGIPVVPN